MLLIYRRSVIKTVSIDDDDDDDDFGDDAVSLQYSIDNNCLQYK